MHGVEKKVRVPILYSHAVLQEKVQSVCGSTNYRQKLKENEEEISSLEE